MNFRTLWLSRESGIGPHRFEAYAVQLNIPVLLNTAVYGRTAIWYLRTPLFEKDREFWELVSGRIK